LGVEHRRFVRDLDVFHQGRDDLVAPALIDKAFHIGRVEHRLSSRPLLRARRGNCHCARSEAISVNGNLATRLLRRLVYPPAGKARPVGSRNDRYGFAMILVFGSINVDVVVPVPHLPRPGETVLGGDYAILPGGKGANQALAACRDGARVMMAGAVGNDEFAAVALAGLQHEGVDLTLVRQVARPTGCASIMVGADGENLIAVASGANTDVRAAAVPDAVLGPGTVLVCQMEVPAAENAVLIR